MNENNMQLVFANESSIGNYNEREMKLFADAWGQAMQHKEGLAVIPVYGALGNGFYDSWGATYTQLTAELERLTKDDKVKCIVLAIDSPGGMCAGMFDACNYIKQVGAIKPVYAYVSGMACSAAFAIATSCNQIFISEDADTGCCGCYAHAMEYSEERLKEEGIISKIFRSKVSPRKNISVITDKQAQEEYQAEIDAIGEKYLHFVAENRGVEYEKALTSFGEGRVVNAQYALENQMVDAIGTLEDCVNTLFSSLEKEEGEGETDMDIKSMSAEQLVAEMTDEQKSAIVAQLGNPSLSDEEREKVAREERERIISLNALRDGSESVDAIVDEAVAKGNCACEIELSVVKAQLENAKNELAEAQKPTKTEDTDNGKDALNKALEMLCGATEQVNVPSQAEMSEQEAIDMLTKN